MGNVGPLEIAVVLIIALVVFGPKRNPELGQSLGKGIREFKASLEGHEDDEPDHVEPVALHDSTAAGPAPAPRDASEDAASVDVDR
jgi:sec-independent protein translocase protein TatA